LATRYVANTGAAIAAVTVLGLGLYLVADKFMFRCGGFLVVTLTRLGDRSISLIQSFFSGTGILEHDATEESEDLAWWQKRNEVELPALILMKMKTTNLPFACAEENKPKK
ncbi:MAG: hypothetical protein KAT44_13850, partial [Pirellulales bacterium]|nr:hypothetical protein [Pirellulales bacterium]